jgi:hypothetical protein
MMLRRLIIAFLGMCISASAAMSRDIQPKAEFLNDTLKIGYPAEFALSITYPSHWQIFFPDSSDDYGIFEYYDKRVFNTRSADTLSTDSVVYQVMSFELDSVQKLALPVYRLFRGDTIEMVSNTDSVMLKEYIETLPPELDLKENALLRFIPDIFNKKLFLIIAAVLLGILLLVALLFGKKILAKWKVYQMTRRHRNFISDLEALIEVSKNSAEKEQIEKANGRWKDYLSDLENVPYNTYSTRDFLRHMSNEELVESLKKLDAFVYGGYSDESLVDDLLNLKHFAEDRFEVKKKEVEHA